MCMQCVAEAGLYVGGAVGTLQVLKVKAAHRRLVSTSDARPADSTPTSADASGGG